MSDELEKSKESGDKGVKDAGESSRGLAEAAGERLSQEGFPSREEARAITGSSGGRNEAQDAAVPQEQQSSEQARVAAPVAHDGNQVKPENKTTRAADQFARNLPNLQLETSKQNLAQEPTERTSENVASAAQKGAKLLGEMSFSNNVASDALKNEVNTAKNEFKTFDNSAKNEFKTPDGNSVNIDSIQKTDKLQSLKSDSMKSDTVDATKFAQDKANSFDSNAASQAMRKSDFQNIPSDSINSESLNKAAKELNTAVSNNDVKALADQLSATPKHQSTGELTKALDKNQFDSKTADGITKTADLTSKLSDVPTAKNDFAPNKTADSKNFNEVQKAPAADTQRAEQNSAKTPAADMRTANENVRGAEALRQNETKPAAAADSVRNEATRQASNDSARTPEQRNTEAAPRTTDTVKPEASRPESARQVEAAKQTEQAPNNKPAVEAKAAEENQKKPAAPVESGAQGKLEAAKEIKPEQAARTQQPEQNRNDDHQIVAAAAVNAANAAREAEKANSAKVTEQQQTTKQDASGNSFNRATTSGINTADAGIQAVKLGSEKPATPVIGRDILPADKAADNKISTSATEKSVTVSATDITGKATRIDAAQQFARLADLNASTKFDGTVPKVDATAHAIKGEHGTIARSDKQELGAKEALTAKGADLAGAGKLTENVSIKSLETSGKASSDPRCLQIDPTVKGADSTRGAEKTTELQGGDAADGDSEDGDSKIKTKRYTVNSNKLYLTGVEISLAALLTMAGAARLRADKAEENAASDANADEQDKATNVFIRRTYMVQDGDTLLSIAEDIYSNRLAAWLIADMNAANIKEAWIDGRRVVELKARQILELPEAAELAQFTSKQRRDFDVEKLITVVTQSTVDRELLQAFLGTVSGEAVEESKNIKGTVRATAAVAAKQQLPELTIDGLEPDETRFPPATGLGAVITDFATMIKQSLKRPTRDLGAVG